MSIYIALGTNIEPCHTYLTKALAQLNSYDDVEVVKQSSIYETTPVGYTDQADFLNMVVEVKTSLTPESLLNICQEIENDLGRKRTIRFGPRTIDLDIILYNQQLIDTDRLIIPHPRMRERAFVLVPLAELAPDALVPGLSLTISKLLVGLSQKDKNGVRFYDGEKI